MKTLLIIGATLAASQCLSEPSGGPDSKSTTGATASATTGAQPETADAGAPSESDAGEPDAARPSGAWLEVGPPPFGVPTVRIPLGQHGATILVPAGARAVQTASGLRVVVGEGKNYSMLVGSSDSDLADVRQMLTNELEDEPRADGALVWEDGGRWFFQLPGAFVCWNDGRHRHDADDIEVMIASCASIEVDAP